MALWLVNTNSTITHRPEESTDSFLPLLASLMATIVLAPLARSWPLFFALLAALVLLAGILCVWRDRLFRRLVWSVCAVACPIHWIACLREPHAPVLWDSTSSYRSWPSYCACWRNRA